MMQCLMKEAENKIIATLKKIRADLSIPFHWNSTIVTILVTWFLKYRNCLTLNLF